MSGEIKWNEQIKGGKIASSQLFQFGAGRHPNQRYDPDPDPGGRQASMQPDISPAAAAAAAALVQLSTRRQLLGRTCAIRNRYRI